MRLCGKGEEALGYWLLAFCLALTKVKIQAKSQRPRAKSYLRSIHIAQPATSTPPKNIAKQ